MKRIINILCLFIFLICIVGVIPSAWAAEYESVNEQVLISETTEYLPDGSKIITSIYQEPVKTRSNLYNVKGTKVHTYADSSGNTLWEFSVQGEFRVLEGASVTCISATCSAEVYDSSWSCTKKSATPSGSRAIANGVFEMKLLGIVVSTESAEVILSCDPYGNLY